MFNFAIKPTITIKQYVAVLLFKKIKKPRRNKKQRQNMKLPLNEKKTFTNISQHIFGRILQCIFYH